MFEQTSGRRNEDVSRFGPSVCRSIKAELGRPDYSVDAALLRRALIDNGYAELAIDGRHAAATQHLPSIHRDFCDRLLVAQAMVEAVLLLTSDRTVARYPGPIRLL